MSKYRLYAEEILEDGTVHPFPLFSCDAPEVDGFAMLCINHGPNDHADGSWESLHNVSPLMIAEVMASSDTFKKAAVVMVKNALEQTYAEYEGEVLDDAPN